MAARLMRPPASPAVALAAIAAAHDAHAPAAERVTCHGLHRDPRKHGQLCHRLLAIMPGPLRFVGTLGHVGDDRDPRQLYLRCERCRLWNVYARGEPLEATG